VARIHPSAVIDAGAKIAADVEIGPFAAIGPSVELASGVVVGSHVALLGRTTIGSGTRIFPHVVLGGTPQVREEEGEATALVIGEDNVLREFVTVHAGTRGGPGCTRIGNDNLLMNNVHVAHDCQIGSQCVLSSFVGIGGHVVIEDHVVVGGMSGVHQFVRVGESVFTGGNAMLSRDAPPFTRVTGDRARFAGINTLGLERRGVNEAAIATIKHAMHLLFQSRLRFDEAAARVERECPGSPEVERLLGFLRESRNGRGFIR
jgi:UDP-N-acetylglucosamine acyltransferase